MDFVAEVVNTYPWIDTTTAYRLVSRAKFFFYKLTYPCEPTANETTRPINNYLDQMWILEACEDLAQRFGIDSAIGYKENGLSVNYDGAKLSNRLVEMIKPIIGVVGN